MQLFLWRIHIYAFKLEACKIFHKDRGSLSNLIIVSLQPFCWCSQIWKHNLARFYNWPFKYFTNMNILILWRSTRTCASSGCHLGAPSQAVCRRKPLRQVRQYVYGPYNQPTISVPWRAPEHRAASTMERKTFCCTSNPPDGNYSSGRNAIYGAARLHRGRKVSCTERAVSERLNIFYTEQILTALGLTDFFSPIFPSPQGSKRLLKGQPAKSWIICWI